jgi:hypothetical protein
MDVRSLLESIEIIYTIVSTGLEFLRPRSVGFTDGSIRVTEIGISHPGFGVCSLGLFPKSVNTYGKYMSRHSICELFICDVRSRNPCTSLENVTKDVISASLDRMALLDLQYGDIANCLASKKQVGCVIEGSIKTLERRCYKIAEHFSIGPRLTIK